MRTCTSSTIGAFVCKPQNTPERDNFLVLQRHLSTAATAMTPVRGDVPPALNRLRLDGNVGALTALGTQYVLMALHRWVPLPPTLQPIFAISGNETMVIRSVADRAAIANQYIQSVLTIFPQALTAAPPVGADRSRRPRRPAPVEGVTSGIRKDLTTLLGIGAGLAAIGGAAVFTKRRVARQNGLEDQAHLLGDDDED